MRYDTIVRIFSIKNTCIYAWRGGFTSGVTDLNNIRNRTHIHVLNGIQISHLQSRDRDTGISLVGLKNYVEVNMKC